MKNNKSWIIAVIIVLITTLVMTTISCYNNYEESTDVSYSEFIHMVKDGDVGVVKMRPREFYFYLTKDIPEDTELAGEDLYEELLKNKVEVYRCDLLYLSDVNIVPLLEDMEVDFFTDMRPLRINTITSSMSLLFPLMLVVIMFYSVVTMVRSTSSKEVVQKVDSTGVTFKDVAGQDEAVESLAEVLDILRDPKRYTQIGAKLPKGVLLVGPPGTGKTLLAKAVAGEAGVPFFQANGSDFIEMYVGLGASRVRNLFKNATKNAPCIVFIDEIDSIGHGRESGSRTTSEHEQTLNQLLSAMDGFSSDKGIVVLAATNRPEVLDPALLRPGRFDRRVIVDRPNMAGRLATLKVHTSNVRLSSDVNLEAVAQATAGAVGAELANLVNEAALRAVRDNRIVVSQHDLLTAFETVIAGPEKKGSVLTEKEKQLVAYHEVGHAMVAYKQKNTEPVRKITIVPHITGALGYTLIVPEEDKTDLRTKEELMEKICVSMGGRAAEEVVFGTTTNGAAQDLKDATEVAKNMVALYGMSETVGPVAIASKQSRYLDNSATLDCAQGTAYEVDQAVRQIIDRCYEESVAIIKDTRDDIERIVSYLLEKETITGEEMVKILRNNQQEDVS